MNKIELIPVTNKEYPEFRLQLQESFAVAVIEKYGKLDEPIPSDKDIDQSFYKPNAESYHIVMDGKKVGGTIVTIDQNTNHNYLELFFINKGVHGKGIGISAWKAIEEKYPDTEVWETGTPYFEKRNIHFYVNKCGFHITKFYHEHFKDPSEPEGYEDSATLDFLEEGFFEFKKVMK